MFMILLQTLNEGGISWVAIGIGIVLSVLGFLIRDAFAQNRSKIINLEQEIKRLNKSMEDERNVTLAEIRKVEKTVNDLNINILDKLDDIKNKFYEFRKQG